MPNQSESINSEESPKERLRGAVGCLAETYFNSANMFIKLLDVLEGAGELRQEAIDLMDVLVQSGESRQESIRFLENLSTTLSDEWDCCTDARNAIDEDGGDFVREALPLGPSDTPSEDIVALLCEAEDLNYMLGDVLARSGSEVISDDRLIDLNDDLKRKKEIGKEFERACRKIESVMTGGAAKANRVAKRDTSNSSTQNRTAEQGTGEPEGFVTTGGGGGDTGPADDDYRPASAFSKTIAGRLRHAAEPGRKTKRVRTKTIQGTKCYCVEDVRRWWPDEAPKNA